VSPQQTWSTTVIRPRWSEIARFLLLLLVVAVVVGLLAVSLGAAALLRSVGECPPSRRVSLPAGRVVILIHGVNDDGAEWAPRIKKALTQGSSEESPPAVYLFRWTQPDGRPPALAHARNSLKAIDEKDPRCPEMEACYQRDVARRLADLLAGVRALHREYGVDGKVDVIAHSQGTLIALAAMEHGADVDNLVCLGSPLRYTDDRQEDVIHTLPHVRGVVYNYYAPDDLPIRYMGGGLRCEPRGWPTKDLPEGKVIQIRSAAGGHMGYLTAEAAAGYRDKAGLQPGEHYALPAPEADQFMEKWGRLIGEARLIDPE
jgi:pimeloyl-ACP methyl ester carboxylesterase